jgi:hypothetical protein
MEKLFECKAQRDIQMQKKTRKKREVDPTETALEKKVRVDDAHAKMNACNRFSVFVRGASPEVYGA